MKLLLLYWSFMIVGYIIAAGLKKKGKGFDLGPKVMMVTIYFLCLVMGLRMGVNEQVISNIGVIGLQALVLTVICGAGSIFAIFVTRKLMGIDRYGNLKGEHWTPEENKKGGAGGALELKDTFIIIAMVAAGMIGGAFVLAGRFPELLESFDVVSGYALIVLLCILLLFVGLDLGFAGNILKIVMKVGFKAFIFAFAAMVGTMIFGVIFCSILGFSLKEGAAICIGFGWYSYTPVVIASAGQEYMIASALSFMHNVIRELSGIIFVPLVARKIGYIESVGIPGGCAMDVCLPIVERSCRSDTTVYAFTTGLSMCIVTSIAAPLIMGV